ncbi:methyltransferase domain-containing protein [Curvivirga aplysinae]|uniref:methyltransferase domain-containing protein n=1 Tax=Curvivirga aplysinae TaxID=2529852 RepID=UPI0012BC78D1|nr:methyltransferase domain-containing protein [Curvivirga aplysinae]MTI08917.1 methyltransferase domain-containing protein [Curvivirga aplysinae]
MQFIQNLKKFISSPQKEVVTEEKTPKQLIAKLKEKYYPESDFVGPYEEAEIVGGLINDQLLWKFRDYIQGHVLDMSTPAYWHHHVKEREVVTKWTICDLEQDYVEKLGHRSAVDIIGDFSVAPPPMAANTVDTILCISILEHCKNPFVMMENLKFILRPGGYLFLQAPFAYIDGHLSPDYWRFGRDAYYLFAEHVDMQVIETGEYLDMGKYFKEELGVDLSATNWHRGVPQVNWAILKNIDTE